MEKTKITLTIDEVNKVLGALGQQPYVHVFELINSIQQQVTDQLKVKAEN
ncbi:MAG TPA: hypothetical protein VIZ28_01310 [Chitinophagaceae bacterium]